MEHEGNASSLEGSIAFATEPQTDVSALFAAKPSIRYRVLNLIAKSLHSNPTCLIQGFHRVSLLLSEDLYPLVRESALHCMTSMIKIGCPETSYYFHRALELFCDDDESVRIAAVRVVSEYGQKLCGTDYKSKQEEIDTVFVQLGSMVRDMCHKVRFQVFLALGKMRFVSELVLLQMLSKKLLGCKDEKNSLSSRSSEFMSSISTAAGAFVHGFEDEFCEALDSILFMEKYACVNMQELQMHMVLGLLVDMDGSIRRATRHILNVLKLHSFQLFRYAIDGLLENLKAHPEEEVEILSILMSMGRNNKNFASRIVDEVLDKMMPSSVGELTFDRPEIATSLVLSLSSLDSCKRLTHVPAKFLSYMLPSLRKISPPSYNFGDDVYQSTSKCASFVSVNAVSRLCLSHMQAPINESREKGITCNDAISLMNLSLLSAAKSWPLIRSRCQVEALKILRSCRDQIAVISSHCPEICCLMSFTYDYIDVMKSLTKIWMYLYPLPSVSRIKTPDILLEKFDMLLIGLKYKYFELSKEEELHILELLLLASVLRLLNFAVLHNVMLKRIHYLISQVDCLLSGLPEKETTFLRELRKGFAVENPAADYCLFARLVELFSLQQLTLSGKMIGRTAEVHVSGNDSESPLPFIAGFPVGIKFQITLRNIACDSRVWLQLVAGDVIEHAFIGPFNDSEDVKQCTVDIPFHQTPKGASFSLLTCVGMECPLAMAVDIIEPLAGPRCLLIHLCKEKKVCFRRKL